MKIKIETTVDIPDDELHDFPMSREEHAKQIVRDGVTDFVRLSHAHRTLELALTGHSDLARRHELWTNICEKLNWKMTVED